MATKSINLVESEARALEEIKPLFIKMGEDSLRSVAEITRKAKKRAAQNSKKSKEFFDTYG